MSLPPAQFSNPDLLAAINKGGSTVQEAVTEIRLKPSDDKLKSFTFKIYESELEQIRKIQQSLPKRDRISISDFVISAVKDRILKESKKRKIDNLN